MQLRLIGIFGLFLGLCIGGPSAHAQETTSSLEENVRAAVHGPDGEGRDGPMAALDRDLITLYYQYQAYRKDESSGSFSPSDESLPVQDSLVTIEAIAADAPDTLLDRLTTLGLQKGARAERLVSGNLPISSLRAAARLSSLQSMQPSRAQVRDDTQNDLAPSSVAEETDPSGDNQEATAETTTVETTPAERQTDPEPSREPPRPETKSDSPSNTTVSESENEASQKAAPQPDSMQAEDSAAVSSVRSNETPTSWTPYVIGGAVLILVGLFFVLRHRSSGSQTN